MWRRNSNIIKNGTESDTECGTEDPLRATIVIPLARKGVEMGFYSYIDSCRLQFALKLIHFNDSCLLQFASIGKLLLWTIKAVVSPECSSLLLNPNLDKQKCPFYFLFNKCDVDSSALRCYWAVSPVEYFCKNYWIIKLHSILWIFTYCFQVSAYFKTLLQTPQDQI